MLPDAKDTSVSWKAVDVALWLVIGVVATVLIAGIFVVVNYFDQSPCGTSSGIVPMPMMLLFSFLALVVVTPLFEEFLFRMLFQGWLEAKLKQLRIPKASGIAIVIASLCFAAVHQNVDSGNGCFGCISTLALFCFFVAIVLFHLPVFIFGLIYLVQVRNVRIVDYLFGTEPFFRPGFFVGMGYCLLALLAYLGLFAILFFLFGGLHIKPFAIFFFSLALGILYSRTQNLSYCVLLHALLNFIAWVGLAVVFCLNA